MQTFETCTRTNGVHSNDDVTTVFCTKLDGARLILAWISVNKTIFSCRQTEQRRAQQLLRNYPDIITHTPAYQRRFSLDRECNHTFITPFDVCVLKCMSDWAHSDLTFHSQLRRYMVNSFILKVLLPIGDVQGNFQQWVMEPLKYRSTWHNWFIGVINWNKWKMYKRASEEEKVQEKNK